LKTKETSKTSINPILSDFINKRININEKKLERFNKKMKTNYINNLKQNFKQTSNGLLPNQHIKYRNSFDQTFLNDEDDMTDNMDHLNQYIHGKTLGGN
jgi:hypothetical protein